MFRLAQSRGRRKCRLPHTACTLPPCPPPRKPSTPSPFRGTNTRSSSSGSAASRTRSSSACSARCGASTAATRTQARCSRCFPTGGARVLTRAGAENAGAVDIGDGLCVVMKVESHNHPSRGRAVRGRGDRRRRHRARHLRDGRAPGRHPRFAPLRPARSTPRRTATCSTAWSRGIGGYGNCLGIPTVGGEVGFDRGYNGNPLVNAMCVGIARSTTSCSARRPRGAGNAAHARRRRHRPRRHPRRDASPARRARRGASRSGAPPCRSATPSSRSC